MDFSTPQTHLNGLTAQQFLDEYWQKKPLLIRGAFPEFQDPDFCPLSPDELAGLALEEDIISRLITGTHKKDDWNIEYGPFHPNRFEQLPESGWSLLVSDVEKHLPDFTQFVDYFRFIPDWRIDDLMVSYAPKDGSVGKHTDEYDVFLLQAYGQRRWQIEDERSQSDMLPGLDIQLLKDFNATQDWILEPGDMLYLPPGVAHYGVAKSDCMTWSFGFRSPSWQSLLNDYCDTATKDLTESQRYADPHLNTQHNPAEISSQALNDVRAKMSELMQMNDVQFANWFGKVVSENACDFTLHEQNITAEQLEDDLASGRELMLSPYVRLAFTQHENNTYQVFINGVAHTLNIPPQASAPLTRILNNKRVEACGAPLHSTIIHWLTQGFNQGHWVWEDELMYDEDDNDEQEPS